MFIDITGLSGINSVLRLVHSTKPWRTSC